MRRRRFSALSPGLFFLALAAPCLAQKPSPSPPPSKETPSYTSDDLDRLAGRKPGEAPSKPPAGTRPSPAAPVPNRVDEGAATFDPDVTIQRSDENAPEGAVAPGGTWADRAQAFREAVAQAEERVKELESQAQTLLWQYLQSTDTNEILQMKAEQQEIMDQIPEARTAIEQAQKALADFEKEAAQAGVPPGDLRPKKTP